ncbi:MAG TPA: hypothetical protein VNX00_12330 [Herbaspirillum sp.]|nr:hypothetical protein [Herbaspirillum sp.]
MLLQGATPHINIVLPDCIQFSYPGDDGHATVQEIDVSTLGENAHGVCFLTGIVKTACAGDSEAEADIDNDDNREAIQPTVTAAFRMDAIIGLITRKANGEQISVRAWEQRVRRRFALDCKTDALPLSTMLITVKNSNRGAPE